LGDDNGANSLWVAAFYQDTRSTRAATITVPVWPSGNALASINAVTLRQARLVPG